MTSKKEPEISIPRTQDLLSRAQLLLKDIEELLNSCISTGRSHHTRHRSRQQECQFSIEEDQETLVVGGFRFESASSRENLWRLSSQAGDRGRDDDA